MKYFNLKNRVLFLCLFFIGQLTQVIGQIPIGLGIGQNCDTSRCKNPPSTNPSGFVTGPSIVEYGETVTYTVSPGSRKVCDDCNDVYSWSPPQGGIIVSPIDSPTVTVRWTAPNGSVSSMACSIKGSCCNATFTLTALNICICKKPLPTACVGCNNTCKSYISNLSGTLKVTAPTETGLKLYVYKMDYSTLTSSSISLPNSSVSATQSLDIPTSGWASGFYSIRVSTASTPEKFLQELRFVK